MSQKPTSKAGSSSDRAAPDLKEVLRISISPPQLCLTLPLPPSINEQYATVNGHRVSSIVARRFKQQVRDRLRLLEQQGVLYTELHTRLRQNHLALFLDFYFTTPLKRDLDGGLKITQDALCFLSIPGLLY